MIRIRSGIVWFAVAAGLSVGAQAAESADDRGQALAKQIDKANEGFVTDLSTLTMELVNAHGDVTTRRLAVETLEGNTDGDRSRVRFEWPADVKGTRLLTWTHKSADDDQWLFLPAIKRVKRISANNKSGAFMGSEFAYEDLGSVEIEKYKHKFLGEVTLSGRSCWQLERIPVDSNSGYKRQVIWFDKEFMNPLRVDFYDRKNELLKTAVFTAYRKFGKFWRAGQIQVQNVQTRKSSRLSWTDRKLGVSISNVVLEPAGLEE